MPEQSERRIDTFFYGLFMDASLLHQSGVTPANPRRAYVVDCALQIGQRATLVNCEGARAFGMLMALTHAELELLYRAPGLEEYRLEAVLAHTLEGTPVPALCYNLLGTPRPEERNPEYAMRLRTTLNTLGFPREYVDSIA